MESTFEKKVRFSWSCSLEDVISFGSFWLVHSAAKRKGGGPFLSITRFARISELGFKGGRKSGAGDETRTRGLLLGKETL